MNHNKHILEWKGSLLVEQIIREITMEYAKNVLKYFEDQGIHDHGAMAEEMLEEVWR